MIDPNKMPDVDYKGHHLSPACWDGRHGSINCSGWDKSVRCECPCHERQSRVKPKKDDSAQAEIMDMGCGTIEVWP